MIQKRDIAVSILLTILTCGIYSIYWFIVLTDDVKAVSGDNQVSSGGVAFLLSIVTCGIYIIYWGYKMGELVARAQANKTLPVRDNAVLYLILNIFGWNIITMALIQNDLNTLAEIK
jgi:hypothetical protein